MTVDETIIDAGACADGCPYVEARAKFTAPFFLKSQEGLSNQQSLPEIELAYSTYGDWDNEDLPVVLVCHTLSGSHRAAHGKNLPGESYSDAWWEFMIGPGKAIDTRMHRVICICTPGSSFGSTSPDTKDPRTQKPYNEQFPKFTMADMVDAKKLLLEHLGVKKLRSVIGPSFGGAQALTWLKSYPDYIESCVPIATTWGARKKERMLDDIQRNILHICIENARQLMETGSKNLQRVSMRLGEEIMSAGLRAARAVAMAGYSALDRYENVDSRIDQFSDYEALQPMSENGSYIFFQSGKTPRLTWRSYVALMYANSNHMLADFSALNALSDDEQEQVYRAMGLDEIHNNPAMTQDLIDDESAQRIDGNSMRYIAGIYQGFEERFRNFKQKMPEVMTIAVKDDSLYRPKRMFELSVALRMLGLNVTNVFEEGGSGHDSCVKPKNAELMVGSVKSFFSELAINIQSPNHATTDFVRKTVSGQFVMNI